MPCRDDYPDPRDTEMRRRLDIATRAACEYFTQLEASGTKIPEYAESWWKQHKIEDELRRKREAKEAEAKRLRESALSKLSPEERKALKIDTK